MEENNTVISNGIKNDSNSILSIYFDMKYPGFGLLSKSTNDSP
jgi:hypothetical protein